MEEQMTKKIEVPEDKIERIRKLYEEGLSDRKISVIMGYKRDVVKRIIRENAFTRTKKEKYPELTKELLEKLYVEEQKSIAEIINIIGYTKSIITTKMNEYGIHRRSYKERSLGISVEELKDLYLNQDLTQAQIAEKFKCHTTAICALLKKHRITKVPKTVITIPVAMLLDMYFNKKMSPLRIAKVFGCHQNTIKSRLVELGVSEYKTTYNINMDELVRLCNEGKSSKELANIFGCSRSTIIRILQNFGMSTKPCSLKNVTYESLYEQLIVQRRRREDVARDYGVCVSTLLQKTRELGLNIIEERHVEIPKDEVEKLYYKQGLTQAEIAKSFNVNRSTMAKKFKEYGIKKHFKYEFLTYDILKEYYVDKNLPPCLIAKELNCPPNPIRKKVIELGLDRLKTEEERKLCKAKAYTVMLSKRSSKAEKEINELFPTDITNDSTIIGLELDLYYPEKRVAIEYNGDYWHSTRHPRNSGLHLAKLKICNNKHIRLINIFERDWNSRKKGNLIELLNRTFNENIMKKVEGKVVDVKPYMKKPFEKKYNLSDVGESTYCCGIINKGKALCTISYNIYDGACYIERFTTREGFAEDYTELFKYMKAKHGLPIMLKVDLRYYNDELPKKYGFKFLRNIEPELFYVKGTKALRKEEATEEYLKHPKCYEVYDCGFSEWIL